MWCNRDFQGKDCGTDSGDMTIFVILSSEHLKQINSDRLLYSQEAEGYYAGSKRDGIK